MSYGSATIWGRPVTWVQQVYFWGVGMNLFRLTVCCAVVVCVFSLGTPAHGQTVTASLQGQVLDASGGGVPKAKVSAINTETALSRSPESDSSGEYSLPAMPPGRSPVSAHVPG